MLLRIIELSRQSSVLVQISMSDVPLFAFFLKCLFLDCVKYPDSDSWQPEHLAKRYYNCLESLREYAQQERLPQYFHRSVNLLKDKNVEEDVAKIKLFDFDKHINKKREAEDVPVLQPPRKIPRL